MVQRLDETSKQGIEALIQQSFAVFTLEDPAPALSKLFEAWERLPGEKPGYHESFLLSKYIVTVFFRTKNYDEALKWRDTFLLCDHATLNLGESEMMAGQIAFELNDLAAAKEYISIANKKSEGRCLRSADQKYAKLLDKAEVRPKGLTALLKAALKLIEQGDHRQALSYLFDCVNLDVANPKVHLHKGICHLELGEPDRAADALTRVYMLQGEGAFKGVAPKYLEFLKTKIAIQ
jgi:tetratricopeptide (TPR) repeat protein